MAVGSYINAGGAIQKTTGIYVGDHDGIARKVAKGYLGDADGIARLWFQPETANPSRLPEGYTEVEYVDTSKSAKISGSVLLNTTVPASTIQKLQMSVKAFNINVGGDSQFIFDTSGKYFDACRRKDSSLYVWMTLAENGSKRLDLRFPVNADITNVILYTQQRRLYIDGKSASVPAGTYKITGNAYIISGPGRCCLPCQLFSCPIYGESNALLRDYVPCVLNGNNTVGLYDLVNNTFLKNQGTGELVAGPAV